MRPWEKYRFCNFDNVCSAIRKKIWEAIPFENTFFAEDLGWSKKVLEAGYAIVYELMRQYAIPMIAPSGMNIRELFYVTAALSAFWPSNRTFFKECFRSNLKDIAFESKFAWREEKIFLRKISVLMRLLPRSLFSVFGQYLGAKWKSGYWPRRSEVSGQIQEVNQKTA